MKKNRHNKAQIVGRERPAQDLALVRGGDNGVIHMQNVVRGGISPNDDGVIHAQ
jgi:hypothetical protein